MYETTLRLKEHAKYLSSCCAKSWVKIYTLAFYFFKGKKGVLPSSFNTQKTTQDRIKEKKLSLYLKNKEMAAVLESPSDIIWRKIVVVFFFFFTSLH